MYCAMIGDLINSKKLPAEDRAAIQERLKALLNGVNENFSSFLVSPFLMTLGDEFQGVLTAAKPALEIIEFLGQNLMEFPIQIRYGIGIGELSTSVNREQALGDDGPAYYYARQGIEQLKKDGWTGFPVSIQTGSADCGLLHCYCQLLNEVAEMWSASQRNCILNMEIMNFPVLGLPRPAARTLYRLSREQGSTRAVSPKCPRLSGVRGSNWAIQSRRHPAAKPQACGRT